MKGATATAVSSGLAGLAGLAVSTPFLLGFSSPRPDNNDGETGAPVG